MDIHSTHVRTATGRAAEMDWPNPEAVPRARLISVIGGRWMSCRDQRLRPWPKRLVITSLRTGASSPL